MPSFQSETFDYIVVGSGAGGGPVAARLAEAGYKVLVLEAGSRPNPDESEFGSKGVYDANYQVPAFHPFASEDPEMRWDFFVRHYASDVVQRQDPKFTPERNGVLYPRSSTVGGCTAHNAMIMIYPHNSDWDYIAEVTGDETWRADNMRKYFQRMENVRYRPLLRFFHKVFRINPARHGFDGWLDISTADPKLVLHDESLLKLIAQSAKAAFSVLPRWLQRIKWLFESSGDPNDWRLVNKSAVGIRIAPMSASSGERRGVREFLEKVGRDKSKQLTIRTESLVTRVIIEEHDSKQVAVGVEYLNGPKLYQADRTIDPSLASPSTEPAETHTVRARREVILAGGAFNTPQLLMLSGIGPADELSAAPLNISPIKNLPGVGRNLQDRYEVTVRLQMKKPLSLLDKAKFEASVKDPEFTKWLAGRDGPYTSNGAVISVIKRSKPERPEPDLFVFGLASDFSGYYPGYSDVIREEHQVFTWAILKAHTNNTAGTVKLESNDPRHVPQINFHYFGEGTDSCGDDLDSVVEGVKFVRQLAEANKDLVKCELSPGIEIQKRSQIKDYIRHSAWGHHASCTAKIGADDDPFAVLDSRLRVRGISNLRVVDASVFPRIPGFFIVTSVYMISEKAAEMIIEDANK